MDRALAALQICADKLRTPQCPSRPLGRDRSLPPRQQRRRRSSNGCAHETGIVLDIISAEEEARLAVLGCHILLEDGTGPAVIFDIGGGSTELVLVEQRRPGAPASSTGRACPGAWSR